MISTDKKFIFVAVMKTGTMSITSTLKKYSLDNDGYHYTARELKNNSLSSVSSKRLGSQNQFLPLYKQHWEEFFTFGFVRNPWDHFVSLYKWCKKHKNPKTSKGFNFFLNDQYRNKYNCLSDWGFTTQSDRLYENGEKIVNFIGKYENIEQEFELICKNIKVEEKLLSINKSKDTRCYKTFYNSQEQIEKIRSLYAEDIERFGYEFE